MELRKHLSLKSNYFRIVIGLLLLCVVVGIYGYYFPKKYLFECRGLQFFNSNDQGAEAKANDTRFWNKSETVKVFQYWYGLRHTLDNHSLTECGVTSDNSIVCNKVIRKNNNELVNYSIFDLDESSFSYHKEILVSGVINRYEGNNFKCDPIRSALAR
jgi:hypothetical protein